jgi:DNA-binding NarL/FixJ family response regulator
MPLPTLHSPAVQAGPPSAKTIRVLVADDHDIVCTGLERMISSQPDMEVCGVALSGLVAIEKAKSLEPNVAVLDVNMAGLDGMECTKVIRKALPRCEVLLFTGLETDELMRDAFTSGARNCLLDAIRALADHRPYFTNKVSEVIFSRMLRRTSVRDAESGETPSGRLNSHELEIVRLLALGESNHDLAQKLGVNLRTAEGQRAALMRKMKFDSLADLVRYAVRNKIVEA